jgi:hypothetical protein
LLGLSVWMLFRDTGDPEPAKPARPVEQAQAPSAPARLPPTVAPPPPSPARLAAYESVNDDIPSGEADGGLRPSHPITPVHERIYKENNMIGAMNAAVDLGNFAELRRLNREYREQYPEDSHLMQDGYDIIADCQERRTPENRAAATRFYDTQIASTLRRYVRKHCLD